VKIRFGARKDEHCISQEIEYQNRAATAGLALPVLSEVNRKLGSGDLSNIRMERVAGTLQFLLGTSHSQAGLVTRKAFFSDSPTELGHALVRLFRKAFESGFFHGDVKLDNIGFVMKEDGRHFRPLFIDFGCAQFHKDPDLTLHTHYMT
jgi:tRNA A-37 threonylcarbamoyl transferase component Bud32